MASELKLSGSAAGRIIVQGNDTITTDQTFTFPDTGGELLTGSTEETGSGGSPGSAQVVGYQQGTWTPTVTSGSPTYDNVAGSFARVGGIVSVRLYFASGSGKQIQIAKKVVWSGLPYTPSGNVSFAAWELFNPDLTASSIPYLNLAVLDNATVRSQSSYTQGFTNTGGNSSNLSANFTYFTDDTTWTPNPGATVS